MGFATGSVRCLESARGRRGRGTREPRSQAASTPGRDVNGARTNERIMRIYFFSAAYALVRRLTDGGKEHPQWITESMLAPSRRLIWDKLTNLFRHFVFETKADNIAELIRRLRGSP